MPYAQSNLKEEEDKNNQGGAPNISGQSTTFATGVPGQEPNKKSSGQYANIQSYLDTNQEQAGEMGQKVASNVEQKGTEAKSGVDKLATSVSKIDAYDPNALIGKITSFNTNPWDPNSGAQAPEITQEEKQKYQSTKSTGGYTGPKDLGSVEGYQDIEAKARQATEAAKGAATEQGQQALLKETYARPTYTAGQNKLDQVLLGGSQAGKQALQNVSSKYSGLEDLFKDTSTQVGNTINDNMNTAYSNQQAFTPAEQAAKDALLNPIQTRAQQKNEENGAVLAMAQEDLSDENVYDDILSRIGLQQGTKIYDMNLASYLNPNQTQMGVDNVATNDERVKYQALADLFSDSSMNQLTSSGKSIDPYTFDKNKFEADRYAKENSYNTAYKDSKGTIALVPFASSSPGGQTYAQNYVQKSLNEHTPEELENIIIPQHLNPPPDKPGLVELGQAMQRSLDAWKQQQKYDRAISVRNDKQGPTEIGSGSFGGN